MSVTGRDQRIGRGVLGQPAVDVQRRKAAPRQGRSTIEMQQPQAFLVQP